MAPASGQIWGILLAGGTGARYADGQSKLLEELGGKTVFEHSCRAMMGIHNLVGMVIVAHPNWQTAYQQIVNEIKPSIPIQWAANGETRRGSVWHGLEALPEGCDIVAVHDAARPLAQPDKINQAVQVLQASGAKGVSLGLPSYNTLKRVADGKPWVQQTLDRSRIWQVHTPQIFQVAALRAAHRGIPKQQAVTDDADLVEQFYAPESVVLMVEDSPYNVKITTPSDLMLLQSILDAQGIANR